jgi:nanoRNase/pAp phosphatase (c-di-AMP/oligoRNAs hydrolase)
MRLITRSDFDGLACAALLEEIGVVDDYLFVHPKDVQDGKVELSGDDITTNLPYSESVHLAFDHHASELLRVEGIKQNFINDPTAPSAARVVFNYYGGKQRFPDVSEALLKAADKGDSAQYTMEEVLHPQGWDLLAFITDPRTGLGRFREFGISNHALMMEMIGYYESHTVDKILELPGVKERTDLYFEHEEPFIGQLHRCGVVHENLVVLDLRGEETIYAGNRFVVYALFPQCNLSMHVLWGLRRQNVSFAVGKSIFNRTSDLDIGALMLEYGGGGHANAGTCQIDVDRAQQVKGEIIARLQEA